MKVLAKLKKGQTAEAKVLQQVPAAADGTFTVRLDPAAVPAGYATDDGQVDLELVMSDGIRQATWSTSVVNQRASVSAAARLNRGAGWALRGAAPGNQLVKFDLAAGTVDAGKVTVDKPTAARSSVKHLSAAKVSASRFSPLVRTSAVTPMETCVVTADKTYYGLTERFAHVYAWSGGKGIVDFNTGSDHTLGIAISSGNGWSQSGTGTISTNSGATTTGVVDANALNKVNYRDYYNSCTPYTYRKPISFNALIPGSSFTYAPHVNYSYCTTYSAGSSVWKQSGTNITFSTGVSLGVANVSAQSGWNTETKVSWNMASKTKVCGSTSSGWVSSPQMDARKG